MFSATCRATAAIDAEGLRYQVIDVEVVFEWSFLGPSYSHPLHNGTNYPLESTRP
jgi:hypothetical protein